MLLKKTETIIRENAFQQKKKKPGIKLNLAVKRSSAFKQLGPEGPVNRQPVSANLGFFFFYQKVLPRIIFSILFRVSSYQIVGKEN